MTSLPSRKGKPVFTSCLRILIFAFGQIRSARFMVLSRRCHVSFRIGRSAVSPSVDRVRVLRSVLCHWAPSIFWEIGERRLHLT